MKGTNKKQPYTVAKAQDFIRLLDSTELKVGACVEVRRAVHRHAQVIKVLRDSKTINFYYSQPHMEPIDPKKPDGTEKTEEELTVEKEDRSHLPLREYPDFGISEDDLEKVKAGGKAKAKQMRFNLGTIHAIRPDGSFDVAWNEKILSKIHQLKCKPWDLSTRDLSCCKVNIQNATALTLFAAASNKGERADDNNFVDRGGWAELEDALGVDTGFCSTLVSIMRKDEVLVQLNLSALLQEIAKNNPSVSIEQLAGLSSVARGEVEGLDDLAEQLRINQQLLEGLVLCTSGEGRDVRGSPAVNTLLGRIGLSPNVMSALVALIQGDLAGMDDISQKLGLGVKPEVLEGLFVVSSPFSHDVDEMRKYVGPLAEHFKLTDPQSVACTILGC
jgi:hypothetical protein